MLVRPCRRAPTDLVQRINPRATGLRRSGQQLRSGRAPSAPTCRNRNPKSRRRLVPATVRRVSPRNMTSRIPTVRARTAVKNSRHKPVLGPKPGRLLAARLGSNHPGQLLMHSTPLSGLPKRFPVRRRRTSPSPAHPSSRRINSDLNLPAEVQPAEVQPAKAQPPPRLHQSLMSPRPLPPPNRRPRMPYLCGTLHRRHNLSNRFSHVWDLGRRQPRPKLSQKLASPKTIQQLHPHRKPLLLQHQLRQRRLPEAPVRLLPWARPRRRWAHRHSPSRPSPSRPSPSRPSPSRPSPSGHSPHQHSPSRPSPSPKVRHRGRLLPGLGLGSRPV
jgi:hypothetical protein